MTEPAMQKTVCTNPGAPEAKESVALLPAEKKLIGWSLGLGVVMLIILIVTSRAF